MLFMPCAKISADAARARGAQTALCQRVRVVAVPRFTRRCYNRWLQLMVTETIRSRPRHAEMSSRPPPLPAEVAALSNSATTDDIDVVIAAGISL